MHYAMRKGGKQTVISGQKIDLAPQCADLLPGADAASLNDIFSVTYEELRRLAVTVRRTESSAATLNPTALVHEAWLKLAGSPAFAHTSRLHFKRIAARAMRQLLIEAARRRHSRKRGGGEPALTISFDDAIAAPACEDDVLRLNDALNELARLNPRHAAMVESRFFGGLDVTETAQLLDVSEATIMRDWRAAKAWLANELRQER